MVESKYKRTKRLAYERGYAAGQRDMMDRWLYGDGPTAMEIVMYDLHKKTLGSMDDALINGHGCKGEYNIIGTDTGRISCSGPN